MSERRIIEDVLIDDLLLTSFILVTSDLEIPHCDGKHLSQGFIVGQNLSRLLSRNLSALVGKPKLAKRKPVFTD